MNVYIHFTTIHINIRKNKKIPNGQNSSKMQSEKDRNRRKIDTPNTYYYT